MNNAEIKPNDASAPVENGWSGMQGPVEAPVAETIAPAPATTQATEAIAPAATETIAPAQEAPAVTVQTTEIADTPMGTAASISENELIAAAPAPEMAATPAPDLTPEPAPEPMPIPEPAPVAPTPEPAPVAPTPEPAPTPDLAPESAPAPAPAPEVEKAPVAMTANEATGNQEKVASQSYDFIDAQGLVHHCTSYEDMQQQIADAREAWHDLIGN